MMCGPFRGLCACQFQVRLILSAENILLTLHVVVQPALPVSLALTLPIACWVKGHSGCRCSITSPQARVKTWLIWRANPAFGLSSTTSANPLIRARWTTSSILLLQPALRNIFAWPSKRSGWAPRGSRTRLSLLSVIAPATACLDFRVATVNHLSILKKESYWGQCESGRAAVGVRRSQAICRGVGDGLSPLAGG